MSYVISLRLSEAEHLCFLECCRKNNLSRQQFLRGIVVDALVEEGFDALRPDEPEGCEAGAEDSESRGATAT